MGTTARILVVDDEAGIRFSLEETLARDGYQVVAVDSGEAALEYIATQEFDLVLVDLKMKGIGGMEVLAALRQQSPDTAVIVLTGHGSLETAVEVLRQGAHDYLFKPCKTVELRESVRAVLPKHQRELRRRELLAQLEHSLTSNSEEIRATIVEPPVTPRSAVAAPSVGPARFLQRGELVVDSMRRVITLDGHLLDLDPIEFDLLAYLASEAPRVISSQELVREVQGHESEPWGAHDVVRSHIYRIRQKVKATVGRTDVIRTVHGVGYTLGE
ncbi:MAG: response regulator transcription factor [Chloroflexota bacterium]|nr:response regulator transcription factor [Chloroflexota bacterium]